MQRRCPAPASCRRDGAELLILEGDAPREERTLIVGVHGRIIDVSATQGNPVPVLATSRLDPAVGAPGGRLARAVAAERLGELEDDPLGTPQIAESVEVLVVAE